MFEYKGRIMINSPGHIICLDQDCNIRQKDKS